MDRKTLVICISALLGLLLLTAVSVFLLYRDPDSKASPQDAKELAAKAQAELLQAVPSDAVMVATFGSLSDAVLALGDRLYAAVKEEGDVRIFFGLGNF